MTVAEQLEYAARRLRLLERIEDKLVLVRSVDESTERTFERLLDSYAALTRALHEAGFQSVFPSGCPQPYEIDAFLREKLGLRQP